MAGAPRSYNDPCGIARALDLVGERWALLVIRELLLGPKRFTQLQRGLREASPNVLSQRLRDLQRSGIVRRYMLDPPASVLVYELTERGYALEPVLIELGRWGSSASITSTSELTVDALLIALKTTFDPLAAGDLRASYELRMDGERFRIDVADARIDVARGSPREPTATLETTATTLRSIVFGRLRLEDAIDCGSLKLAGDHRIVARLIGSFTRPAKPTAPPAPHTTAIAIQGQSGGTNPEVGRA